MKSCRMTITTATDGQENSIVRDGDMKLSCSSALLRYQEENAFVIMKIEGEVVEIERQGDYTLHLKLKKNEILEGSIGIGGSEGPIQAVARKVSYSVTKDSILLSLHYDLIFGVEIQTIKLRVISRFFDEEGSV